MSMLGKDLELQAIIEQEENDILKAVEVAKKFQNQFGQLFGMVVEDHRTRVCTSGGHDVSHPIIAAQYAALIAPDERLVTLGWLAGMCHNTDRIFPKEEVRERVECYLATAVGVSDEDRHMVVEAVMTHAGLNKESDNPVTVVLKDADRLSGLGFLSPIRAGQCFPAVPVLDIRYPGQTVPGSTYRKPATILDNLKFVLEWRDMLRLPKAKQLAEELCRQHQAVIGSLETIIKGLGLDSFKF